MPVITMSLGIGQINAEQKAEFIKTVTEEASRIIELPEHTFTILINETGPDNIGIGGKTLRAVQASHK